MKKAILTNRIYIDVTPELAKTLEKELTHKIPSRNPYFEPDVILKMWKKVTPTIYSIPGGRTDLIPPEHDYIDRSTSHPVEFPEFKFTLRQDQQDIYSKVESSCLINANPSWGKTFTALAIAGKLKQKTLVVCHTTVLRDQWAKECEKVYGFSPSIIGGGKVDTSGILTVANIQTLQKCFDSIKNEFGLVILDECHHVSARTFNEIIDKSSAKYKIGLSGTLKRKDGKHVMFPDLFGGIVYIPERANQLTPEVVIIKSNIFFTDYEDEGVSYGAKVTKLAQNKSYQNILIDITKSLQKMGHVVLLVADRVELLQCCYEGIGPETCEIVTGETPQEYREAIHERVLNKEKTALCGTVNIYSEGTSINSLSALVMGLQINNDSLLEQLIGRIQRKLEGKPTPVIVDIHLKGKGVSNQINSRLAFYASKGYKVRVLN